MTDKAIIIKPMSKADAVLWKGKLGSQVRRLRELIYEGHERQAWRALGFENWTACVKALAQEYELTERRLWQIHEESQVAALLKHVSVNEVPGRHLRELKRLPEGEIPDAYQRAMQAAPDGKPTAAIVKSVVDDMLPRPASPNPARTVYDAELARVDAEFRAAKAAYDGAKETDGKKHLELRNRFIETMNARNELVAKVNRVSQAYDQAASDARDSAEPEHNKASATPVPAMPDFDALTEEPEPKLDPRVRLVQSYPPQGIPVCSKDEWDALVQAMNFAMFSGEAWRGFSARRQLPFIKNLLIVVDMALDTTNAMNLGNLPDEERQALTNRLLAIGQRAPVIAARLKPKPEEAKSS